MKLEKKWCTTRIYISPKFLLLSKGRYKELCSQLHDSAHNNGKQIYISPQDFEALEHSSEDDSATSLLPPPSPLLTLNRKRPWTTHLQDTLSPLFVKEYLTTTLLLWLIWFLISLGMGMFGSFLPVFLQQSSSSSSSSGTPSLSTSETYRNYLIITLSAVPGTCLASVMIDSFLGRKGLMALSTFGTAACLYLFTLFTTSQGQLAISCLAQFLGNILWGVLYSYSSEVYPTPARTLGFGIASALGRVGGALAPLLAGRLLQVQLSLTLHVSALIVVLSGIGMALLPIETKGRTLSWGVRHRKENRSTRDIGQKMHLINTNNKEYMYFFFIKEKELFLFLFSERKRGIHHSYIFGLLYNSRL